MNPSEKTVRLVSLVLSALSTGVLFGTKVSLGPSTRGFGASTYVEVQQATVRNLRPVMGTLLPGAVAANLVLAGLLTRHGRSPVLPVTLVGLVGQLSALVLTGAIELPINARVLTWSTENPPAGWEATRDRWENVHTLRTATSIVGLCCLAYAAVFPSESASVDQRLVAQPHDA